MRRLIQRPVSADAGERLGRLLDAERRESPAAGRRLVAQAVGELVHRMFESWELEADPSQELERQRQLLLHRLPAMVEPEMLAEARLRAEELLQRFEGGELIEVFVALRGQVVGREIPVVLPPAGDAEGPLGFSAGAVDLLYRHPSTQALTIVDFKTDVVETEGEIAERAAAYASQEQGYARAIQEAMDLAAPPDTELWFLWPDRRWSHREHG